jgi:Zn-finger nucleic acid-binding protein
VTTETRYPCPVCLGVKMEKIVLATGALQATSLESRPRAPHHAGVSDDLVLDHCARCGGVWFEAGEVQRLRRCEAELLWREIVRRDGAHVMLCHSCRSPLARHEPECGVCGWRVELDCPTCARPLDAAEQDGMLLDYCRHCKGVWFDHAELAGIWRLEMDAAVARRRSRTTRVRDTALDDGADALLTALYFDPFLLYYGAHAAGHVAGAAAEGLAHVAGGSAEAMGEIAGAAGEAASGLFETIVEIIGGIFG